MQSLCWKKMWYQRVWQMHGSQVVLQVITASVINLNVLGLSASRSRPWASQGLAHSLDLSRDLISVLYHQTHFLFFVAGSSMSPVAILSAKCYFEISGESAPDPAPNVWNKRGAKSLRGLWRHSQGREVGEGWEGETCGVTPSFWVCSFFSKMVVIFNKIMFRCHWNSLITILQKSASNFWAKSFSFINQSLPCSVWHQNLMWRSGRQWEIFELAPCPTAKPSACSALPPSVIQKGFCEASVHFRLAEETFLEFLRTSF